MLQAEMHIPCGRHFKKVNTVPQKAVINGTVSVLHFKFLGAPGLFQVTGSGHITRNSCSPIEGRMVLLMSDSNEIRRGTTELYAVEQTSVFSGASCCLYMRSKKAQRVSYSTSHSETKPADSCMAISNPIAARITELEFYKRHGRYITIKDLVRINLKGEYAVAVNTCTDVMNL
jgi:hypothetical protein